MMLLVYAIQQSESAISSVQSLSHVRIFETPWTAARQASLGISNFLEQISSLSQSIVFLYFFSLISEEGFLISPRYSLELCIQMGISFLFFFAFFFSSLFLRPPQTTMLPFCISFSWKWSWSLPLVQCHEPLFIVLQALWRTVYQI